VLAGRNVKKLELSYVAHGNVEWYSLFGNSLGVPQKVKPCDLTILLLGMYPREMKHAST
jgi:hypothetical protein